MSNNYYEQDEEQDDEQLDCPEPTDILRGRTEDLPKDE
jgi:hypothetical protein